MNEEMGEEIKKQVKGMNIQPEVEQASTAVTMASEPILRLLAMIRSHNIEEGRLAASIAISGLALTISDNTDEALGILSKAREQIIKTDKELNQSG